MSVQDMFILELDQDDGERRDDRDGVKNGKRKRGEKRVNIKKEKKKVCWNHSLALLGKVTLTTVLSCDSTDEKLSGALHEPQDKSKFFLMVFITLMYPALQYCVTRCSPTCNLLTLHTT